MRKIDIDYSNTIIYKITCKDPSITHVYVGHTINFVKRKQCHKQSCNNDKNPANNCKLYKVIRENGGWENWTMEIVNFFNCHDHYEQEYFVLLNATLNSIEPMPKPKEEYNDDQPTIKPVCETCNKIFDNEQLYTAHVNTNNHKKRLDNTYSQPNFIISKFECKICHFKCDKQSNWNKHLLTPKHKRQIFWINWNKMLVQSIFVNIVKRYTKPEIVYGIMKISVKYNMKINLFIVIISCYI